MLEAGDTCFKNPSFLVSIWFHVSILGKITRTSNWQWSPCKNEGPSILNHRQLQSFTSTGRHWWAGRLSVIFLGSWWTLKKICPQLVYYEAFLGNLKTPVTPKGKKYHGTHYLDHLLWCMKFWVYTRYVNEKKIEHDCPEKHLTRCGLEDYFPFWDTMCLKC